MQKDLPDIELFLRLFRDKYENFISEYFNKNSEDYLINLQKWKLESEKKYLNFRPIRHRKLIRGQSFYFLNFLWKCIVVVDIYNLDNRKLSSWLIEKDPFFAFEYQMSKFCNAIG